MTKNMTKGILIINIEKKLLDLQDSQKDESIDYSDYFNAWNFGQTEKDYIFVTRSSVC